MYYLKGHTNKLLADFISQIETLPAKFQFISQFLGEELFHNFASQNYFTFCGINAAKPCPARFAYP